LPLLKAGPLENTPESILTAKLVNELSQVFHERLKTHALNTERTKRGLPIANIVLLRGCGSRIKVPSFFELHNLNAFMIAPTAIIAGLGMSVDIDIIKSSGTGDYRTNLASKGVTLVDTILQDEPKSYDFGFLHLKAVDDAGHDRNVDIKLRFLEAMDTMIGSIVTSLAEAEESHNTEFTIVLTGDHATPVLYGDHSCEPVPFVITKVHFAKLVMQLGVNAVPSYDPVQHFSEIDASCGILGRFPGMEVMKIIKSFAGVGKLY